MIDVESSFFEWRGHRLHSVSAGQGDPIVFLHNGGADVEVWSKQFEHFSKTHAVHAFDFLGYGKSDAPARPYTLEMQTSQLEEFFRFKRLERAVLIGNCVGAATAIEFATRHPDKVDRLVLSNVCGGPSFYPPLRWMQTFRPLLFASIWIYAKFFYDPKILWGPKPDPNDPLYRHIRENIVSRPSFFRSRYDMTIGSLSFAKFGEQLSLPENFPASILFWGEQNKIMNRKHAEICLKYLKSEKFYSLKTAGHLCFYEESRLTNQEIDRFLSR